MQVLEVESIEKYSVSEISNSCSLYRLKRTLEASMMRILKMIIN